MLKSKSTNNRFPKRLTTLLHVMIYILELHDVIDSRNNSLSKLCDESSIKPPQKDEL